jgi:membrane associated rhomboid family serine protease
MADSTPARREPAFNVPGVVLACCVVLLGIHAIRGFISTEADNRVVALFAFVPARLTIALHLMPTRLSDAYNAIADRDPVAAAQVNFLIGDGQARWWTLLTYAFLHGSWAHVGFNCVWLVAFGSAVARRFASLRFLLLMAVSALAGALAQYLADMVSFQIVLGASAAVSGAMGAATRFVFRPGDEPARLFDRASLDEAFRQPALSLRQTFTTKAALVFVIFWFATNLLFGTIPGLGGVGDGPIAWQAHIGGFLAGLLLFPLFDPRRPASTLRAEDSADLPLEMPPLE